MKYLLLAAAITLLIPVACISGTGGDLVDIEIALGGEPAEQSFETSLGWTVRLEQADVAIGPLYVFAPRGAPLAWLLVPRAMAHGGFDPLDGRRVRSELLEQLVVDTLSEATTSFEVPAETGEVTDVRVSILPHESLENRAVWLRGSAERDGQVVRFEGGAKLREGADYIGNIPVDGELGHGGRLDVRIRPELWVDGIDFASEGASSFAQQSQSYEALRVALRNPRSFQTSWTERGVE